MLRHCPYPSCDRPSSCVCLYTEVLSASDLDERGRYDINDGISGGNADNNSSSDITSNQNIDEAQNISSTRHVNYFVSTPFIDTANHVVRVSLDGVVVMVQMLGQVLGDVLDLVVYAGDRRAVRFRYGDEARPDFLQETVVLHVFPVVGRRFVAHFTAAGLDGDPEDARAGDVSLCGWQSGVLPAVGDDLVGDDGHGVQDLVGVRDELGVAEQHGRSVVERVVEAGQREYHAVDPGRRDAQRKARFTRRLGLAHQVVQPGAHIAVQVALERFIKPRAGVLKGAHGPDHGQDGWELVLRVRRKGHIDDEGAVDQRVDEAQLVSPSLGSRAHDGVARHLGVFKCASHGRCNISFAGLVMEGKSNRKVAFGRWMREACTTCLTTDYICFRSATLVEPCTRQSHLLQM